MADIKWITMNGAHIPIVQGESKMSAVRNFIKTKRRLMWVKKYKELQEADIDNDARARHGRTHIETAHRYVRSKLPTIKGRTKTKEEKYNEINKEYDDKVAEAEKGYLKDKYTDWADYGAHMRAYNQKVEQAFKERSEKVAKGNLFKTDRYKLKAGKETPTKKAITGYGKTERMKKADKDYDRQYNKAEQRVREALHMPSTVREKDEAWGKYQRASKTAKTKKTKAYTYTMNDINRQRSLHYLTAKAKKLDRQMDKATGKELTRLGNKFAKNQQKIATIGGKYLVGDKEEWKRIRRGKNK